MYKIAMPEICNFRSLFLQGDEIWTGCEGFILGDINTFYTEANQWKWQIPITNVQGKRKGLTTPFYKILWAILISSVVASVMSILGHGNKHKM